MLPIAGSRACLTFRCKKPEESSRAISLLCCKLWIAENWRAAVRGLETTCMRSQGREALRGAVACNAACAPLRNLPDAILVAFRVGSDRLAVVNRAIDPRCACKSAFKSWIGLLAWRSSREWSVDGTDHCKTSAGSRPRPRSPVPALRKWPTATMSTIGCHETGNVRSVRVC